MCRLNKFPLATDWLEMWHAQNRAFERGNELLEEARAARRQTTHLTLADVDRIARQGYQEGVRSLLGCEHANENPSHCKCPPECYCQTHTCKEKQHALLDREDTRGER